MNTTVKTTFKRLAALALTVSATVLTACGQNQLGEPQPIKIDGSSTVYPITKAIAEQFKTRNFAEIAVSFSGTGGGFEKFCAGETDINNASRPISRAEMETCKGAGISYIELPVAFDAITVVVNPQNNWASEITIAELKRIWKPEAQQKITTWNQVRTAWPSNPLKLYGPGSDSGTFDYFTEAVIAEEGVSRSDYIASEDDELLQQQIASDPNALGYFGFAYYQQNKDELKALAIDSGSGPVFPSVENVERAEYQPLARPLFVYINAVAVQRNPAMIDFIEYYLSAAPEVVNTIGYIPFDDSSYQLLYRNFHKMKVGTVFDGKSEFNLTLDEVLLKRAEY